MKLKDIRLANELKGRIDAVDSLLEDTGLPISSISVKADAGGRKDIHIDRVVFHNFLREVKEDAIITLNSIGVEV
jgi:hypothetical protein